MAACRAAIRRPGALTFGCSRSPPARRTCRGRCCRPKQRRRSVLPRLPGERGGERKRARAFRNRPRFLGDQPHRIARLLERHGDRAVGHRPHPLPHPLGDALAAGAVDEGRLPVRELAGPPSRSDRHRARRSRAPRRSLSRRLAGLDRAADAGDQPAAADGADHGSYLGQSSRISSPIVPWPAMKS